MMNMEEFTSTMMCTSMLMVTYAFNKTHIMNNLITIEFIVVSILMMTFHLISSMKMESYLILYLMIILICESMVGLSMMIAMIRTHGNDYMKSVNLLKF